MLALLRWCITVRDARTSPNCQGARGVVQPRQPPVRRPLFAYARADAAGVQMHIYIYGRWPRGCCHPPAALHCCCGVQVAVRHGEMLLRDTVIWDVAQPFNSAELYAAMVCEGLGLRLTWFSAIVAHVQQLVADVQQVRRLVRVVRMSGIYSPLFLIISLRCRGRRGASPPPTARRLASLGSGACAGLW